MSTILRVTLFAGLALSAGTACSTARASAPIERPPLDVPPPPPRVIVPLPPPQAPLPDPVEDLPPNPTTGNAARPRPAREKAEPPKTEAKPETPAEPPAQQPAPPVPSPQLRMPENVNDGALTGQIRDSLGRTRGTLQRIDRNSLTEARKKAHSDAQLFAQQADDALKTGNLVFAKELAEKAERLAKELQGR